MTTYPAYLHGLTIEQRDFIWCVTNDFGGRIIHTCLDLDDAIEMRERVAIGFSAEAIALVAAFDATKNRAHAAAQVIAEVTGSEPFRFRAHRSNLIRYAVECPAGVFSGEAYDDEPHADAVAMERLMSAVCAADHRQLAAAE